MLKNILNLEGAQQLSKNEQKEINGGRIICNSSPYDACFDGDPICNIYGLPICVKKSDNL